MNKTVFAAALAGVIAAGAAMSANAEDKMMAGAKDKCYGIAKAGKNDCRSANGSHSCAGQAKADHDANDWKFADKAACEKEGGKLTPPAAAAAPAAPAGKK